MRCGLLVMLGLLSAFGAGCQKKAAPAQAANPQSAAPNGGGLQPAGPAAGIGAMFPSVGRVNASNDLKQIALYYKEHESGGKAPSRLEDLAGMKRDLPKVYQAIADGIYVVYWSAPPSTSGSSILAHVRDAPTKGGVVVHYDGSVENVTAEKFQTADKVGK